MSVRGTKRMTAGRADEQQPSTSYAPSTSSSAPSTSSKRRRTEPEDALWQLRPVSDLKMSSIYNRSASDAPAELFRKDLISAMKLQDSEPLTPNEYWVITDTWKQDWERGVQVPVNPDSLPAPKVKEIDKELPPNFAVFKLPKKKYVHLNSDAQFKPELHQLSTTPALAEAACNYDMDATDSAWLKLLNAERARAGALPVTEDKLERVIEELELRCWDKIQSIIKSEEGLGIEYDENVICDVCRSPDSEEGNEMVFCDSCNICVHQACYGITAIPSGQWLCRPCRDGVRPTCALCPNLGGAMKCTPNGNKWAHVSCVLWIPEVSIGCPEKMEPITKISAIPTSRWSLVCILCRERKGACIQCSVKTCKTAYHVTCAFKHGLEMRAIIEDENADDGVKLRSYCQKHSVNSKKDKCPGSGSEEEEVKRKRRKDMTSEEKSQARAARLKEIEVEFEKHVSMKDISTHLLDVDQEAIIYIFNYWKLKRRAASNRPLLPPKADDSEFLTHKQEQADIDKMKMFVQLRQDLERVRNLCYMVSRREKLSRSFFRMREQTFHKQLSVLSSGVELPTPNLEAIVNANHGPSIYDHLYSQPESPDDNKDSKKDFKLLLSRIAGEDSINEKRKDINGKIKSSKGRANPYKKVYVNGSSRRSGGSIYSGMSSEEKSSSDDIHKPSTSQQKKKVSRTKDKSPAKKTERKKRASTARAIIESSSEGEIKPSPKKNKTRSKTLRQMAKEMAAVQSDTESDDLMPIRSGRNNKFSVDIYSDSSENGGPNKTEVLDKSPNNDSQQPLPRTKAAMKEFIPTKSAPEAKKRGRKPSSFKDRASNYDEAKNKENIKISKGKEYPSDLIVPQRQAAKKASENMRSTTSTKAKDVAEIVSDKYSNIDEKLKFKGKSKQKDSNKKSVVDSIEFEKETTETIAYVPQRQAAKKAAAHIKSGLGNKQINDAADDKRKDDNSEISKKSPKKDEEKRAKSPTKSSSSSSNSSSSYSSSSSSEEEEQQQKPEAKPCVKAREIKPVSRQPSLFSPQPSTRPTVDLPFLDKVSRPLSSTSASSDSDSSKGSPVSGSRSPSPKRTRPRRKDRNSVSDASPLKAPDKKLKTSERRSECRNVSPTAKREESARSNDSQSATRSRTRSVPSSRVLSSKCDARQRKPSKDDVRHASGSNKTSKEVTKSSELPSTERKADETLNKKKDHSPKDLIRADERPSTSKAHKHLTFDEKHKETDKVSPHKHAETKHKHVSNRRVSVKDTSNTADVPQPSTSKEWRSNKYDSHYSSDPVNKHLSLSKPSTSSEKSHLSEKKVSPPKRTIEISEREKQWFAKASSPSIQPPPVEKPGDNEKYMTEDKSLDSDSADKSSINMIAKIQATLNENTMIKSPKTPMDARAITTDHMDIETPLRRHVRKHSTKDTEKKLATRDASNVQGIEISKTAKVLSSGNTVSRSIFSPQPRDNELIEFNDMLAVDDGFNHEEIMKPFTYSEFMFKEDPKGDRGVQETLNLVEKLRMTLSTKKPPQTEITDQEDVTITDDNDVQELSDNSKCLQNESAVAAAFIDNRSPVHSSDLRPNHLTQNIVRDEIPVDMPIDMHCTQPLQNTNNEKWSNITILPAVSHAEQIHHMEVNYASKDYVESASYADDSTKDGTLLQTDVQSTLEMDRDNVSKQSDDSQSLSVVDHSMNSNDHESISQENQTNDNNNSLIHSDCATISSPYIENSQDSKWRESKITQRRSSASSTNSDGSVCSQKTDLKSHITVNSCDSHPTNMMPEMDTYHQIPQYPCSMEPLPLSQYNPYAADAASFMNIGSMPLFPPGPCVSQLTLPSPGGPLYPPSLNPYSSTSLLPALPKAPAFATLCAAAFTTSSQNIALTTAMIAPPTPKPIDSPRDDLDTGSDKFSMQRTPSPTVSVDSYNDLNTNRSSVSKLSVSESGDSLTVTSQPDVKSPSKSQKSTSSKFMQMKSPGKSPGISPRQSDRSRSSSSKRSSHKTSRSRGRGRPKSRGLGGLVFPGANVDYLGNSIQSKLVGTVYDFDKEIANVSMDLRALRERRKSIDVHDRRSENSSNSPRVTSPIQQSHNRLSSTETKDARPTSPVVEDINKSDMTSPMTVSSDRSQSFQPPVVQAVLPGPVDMRTYQSFDTTPVVREPYHSHLLASFASGTADQQLADIDEEVEKQLHSALMASKPDASPKPAPVIVNDMSTTQKYNQEVSLPRVSLSDSRNQLKVKIKGPFLDANYSTSSVQPVVPQPPISTYEPPTNIMGTPSVVGTSGMMTGTTNLRRMRKKELLRQYWTQDMNMDDPNYNTGFCNVPPPVAPPPLSRAVITIPKAVASMTSIPTREDYRGYSDPIIDKKKRKTTSGLSRELRHLEVSMNDDADPAEDVKLSTYSTPSAQYTHKRKGRVLTKPNKAPVIMPVTPKLKIKIGSNFIQPVAPDEPMRDQFRPPKKRLASLPKPSLEEMRRESMKYRKMVMADFEEDEKVKKVKLKSEKRKRKKEKKAEKMRVVNTNNDSATKLIIKIQRTKESTASASGNDRELGVPESAPLDPFEYDPSAPDPLAIDPPSYAESSSAMRKVRTAKVTPIRLKLSRNAEGYVMKDSSDNASDKQQPEPTLPLVVTKHCEVR